MNDTTWISPELASAIASGTARSDQWNYYWGLIAKQQRTTVMAAQLEPQATKTKPAVASSSLAGAAGAAGIGFGSALAMLLSFQLNHSIFWAIAHGICSWLYVIYRAWQGNY